jgi:hypothetical protein
MTTTLVPAAAGPWNASGDRGATLHLLLATPGG